jgi:PAS domain S-box-containing protein/putative nucleotidyltransferase with HDIG domain
LSPVAAPATTTTTASGTAMAEQLPSTIREIDTRLGELVEQLRERERELTLASAAIEHAGVALSIFSLDGRFRHVNEEACRRTGYTADEYASLHAWDIAPDFTPERISALWAEFEPSTPLRYETTSRCKDGRAVPLDVSIRVMDFEGEQLIVAFSVDISERKRNEAALRESEQRFAHAFQGSPVSMSIVDHNGVYLEVNRAWEEHTGYSAEEAVGRHASELPRWSEKDGLNPSVDLFESGDLIEGVEAEFLMKDGARRIGLITVEPLEVAGQTCILTAIDDITKRKRAEAEAQATMQQLETLTHQTITTMARLVEARDPYTAGHEQRVTQLSIAIANELELDEYTKTGINVAGQLHDIGKMIVPAEILAKPGRLSFAEFSLVKGHAKAGADMLSEIDFPWPVAEIVAQHHERLDGSGYPKGLKEGEILTEALIVAVADVVEAMSAHRPYRPSLGVDAALAEIERGSGTQYDAAAVDACLKLFREQGFAFS